MTARSILTSIVAAALALSVCVTGVAAQPAGTLLVVASGGQVLQCDIPAAGFLGGQRPMSHCKT